MKFIASVDVCASTDYCVLYPKPSHTISLLSIITQKRREKNVHRKSTFHCLLKTFLPVYYILRYSQYSIFVQHRLPRHLESCKIVGFIGTVTLPLGNRIRIFALLLNSPGAGGKVATLNYSEVAPGKDLKGSYAANSSRRNTLFIVRRRNRTCTK